MLLLDLLGPYCDNRIMNMSCWMSRWNDNPSIVYILCVFAHIVAILCIFSRQSFFLPCQVRMGSIICYYVISTM